MTLDFSLSRYKSLISVLKENDYKIYPFKLYNQTNAKKNVILRHDVDRKPENALKMAELESKIGVYGTYYFRIQHEVRFFDHIKKIIALGHEVGYHYEEINTIIRQRRKCAIKKYFLSPFNKKNHHSSEINIINEAYLLFQKNLSRLRTIADISTISMHGNPISKYDNRILWEEYDYKQLGILGEPYFDIDWNIYAYLTDTGRKWNGNGCNIRDKVDSKCILDYRNTKDIINNVKMLPDKILITVHPERWTDNIWNWVIQLFIQNIKNVIKIIYRRLYIKKNKYTLLKWNKIH